MNNTSTAATSALAIVTAIAATTTAEAQPAQVTDLIAKIKSTDDKVRGPAWQAAGPLGAPAVKPLVALMADSDYEIARSAKRALWKVVRHAGRPAQSAKAKAVVAELLLLLGSSAVPVQREILWMLSELSGDEAVPPIAALLGNVDVREDARCALQRIPGPKSLEALKAALGTVPEEFKYALADSLRARGETVSGYPTKKLTPTKQTSVQAAS